MKFGEMPQMNNKSEKIENQTNEIEKDLRGIENVESRELVIEKSQGARKNLFEKILKSKIADLAGDVIPGVDIPKMFAEAYVGKTTSGEILSDEKRFSYVAISAVTALAYGLAMNEAVGAAVAARGAAAFLSSTEFGPEVVKMVAAKLQERKTRVAGFMDRTVEYFKEKKDLFIEAGAGVVRSLNMSM